MNSLKILFFIGLCVAGFLSEAAAQARIFDRSLYEYERESQKRNYDRYDIDRLAGSEGQNRNVRDTIYDDEGREILYEDLHADYSDSTKTRSKVFTSPEELRKLGVSEQVIEELTRMNNQVDSLELVKKQQELRQKEKKKDIEKKLAKKRGEPYIEEDSVNIGDLQREIERDKQRLIERALALPPPYLYGHEFFRRSNFKLLDERDFYERTPDHYTIGVGDELNVAIWGATEFNKMFTVDEEGAIKPALVGRIYLRGMTYKEARELVKQRFAKIYALEKNTEIAVSMAFKRIIAVNFVGEYINPGTYKFPATTSVFNAIAAIAGPGQLGSVRQIFVRRKGQVVKELDLYEYLSKQHNDQDFFLEHNDYVLIPPAGKVVHIRGAIRRTHNYELKDGEGLSELLKFAGGLKGDAFTKNISIQRFKNNRATLIDVDWDNLMVSNKNFALENGDSINILHVPADTRNYVEVIGAARQTGKFSVREGDRLSDLFYKTEGLLEDADPTRSYVIRMKSDQNPQIIPFSPEAIMKNPKSASDLVLQHRDTVQIVSRRDFRTDFSVNVSGAVGKAGEYQFAYGMTLKDLLYMAGGMKGNAANMRVEVSRLVGYTDEKTNIKTNERIIVKRAEITPDLNIDASSEDFEIKPFDYVFVRSALEREKHEIVKIYGEVLYPGDYSLLSKQERLSSLLERVGGLMPQAFVDGIKLFRWHDTTGYVLLDVHTLMQKAPQYDGKRKRRKERKREAELEAKRLEGIGKYDYILFENDSIFIPKQTNIVTLSGALRHYEVDSIPRISVPFEPNRRANHYIEEYGGGFGRYAQRMRTYVQQPDGKVAMPHKFLWRKIYPKVENGASIFVDLKDRKKYAAERARRRKYRDWNKAFDSAAAKVSAVLTLFLLIQQVTK